MLTKYTFILANVQQALYSLYPTYTHICIYIIYEYLHTHTFTMHSRYTRFEGWSWDCNIVGDCVGVQYLKIRGGILQFRRLRHRVYLRTYMTIPLYLSRACSGHCVLFGKEMGTVYNLIYLILVCVSTYISFIIRGTEI